MTIDLFCSETAILSSEDSILKSALKKQFFKRSMDD